MPRMRSEFRDLGVRENLREDPARLTRRRGMNNDKFYVPENLKDPDMSYEWKAEMVMGKPNMEHMLDLTENHWQAVQAKDMPGLMPPGHEGAITRGGCVLMKRPKYLTEDAEQEILDMARDRLHTNNRRLGQSAPDELPRTAPKVNRDYVPPSAEDRRLMESRLARRDAIPS